MDPKNFTYLQLTPEEEIQGAILSNTQKRVIQNLIANTAAEVVRTTLSANDPDVFAKIAYAKGQLSVLTFLLDQSDRYTGSN